MTGFRAVADPSDWQADFERRLAGSLRDAGLGDEAAARRTRELMEDRDDWTVVEITDGADPVGVVAVVVRDDHGALAGRVVELRVDPSHQGRGHEDAARDWAERWCAERGAERLQVRLFGHGAPAGVFGGYPVRGQTRMRVVGDDPKPFDGVTARPMTPNEYPGWLAAEHEEYVLDIVRSGSLSPEEARRKSERDFATLLPEGLATPSNTLLVLEAEGARIGTGWLCHGFLPDVTFGYSLHVEPEYRGRGYGRAAMAVGEHATLAGGDSAMMFNVFGGNEVAMNLYTSAGYRVLEENRAIDLAAPA